MSVLKVFFNQFVLFTVLFYAAGHEKTVLHYQSHLVIDAVID